MLWYKKMMDNVILLSHRRRTRAGLDGDRPPRTGKIDFKKKVVVEQTRAEKKTPEDVSGPVERQILTKQARKAG